MTRLEILSLVRANLTKLTTSSVTFFSKEDATEDVPLNYRGVGLTSVQLLSLIVMIENEIEVELDDEDLDLTKLESVGDLVTCIDNALKSQNLSAGASRGLLAGVTGGEIT